MCSCFKLNVCDFIKHITFPICFKVGKKIFVKEDSAGEKGASFRDESHRKQQQGLVVDNNSFKDLFNSEIIAHILAAWMHFAVLDTLVPRPTRMFTILR